MHGIDTIIRMNTEAAHREEMEARRTVHEAARLRQQAMEDRHHAEAIARFEDEGGNDVTVDREGVDEGSY